MPKNKYSTEEKKVIKEKILEMFKQGINILQISVQLGCHRPYVYSIKDRYRHSYRLYPYSKLNDDLLNGYKTYYDKFMSIVTSKSDKISYKPI